MKKYVYLTVSFLVVISILLCTFLIEEQVHPNHNFNDTEIHSVESGIRQEASTNVVFQEKKEIDQNLSNEVIGNQPIQEAEEKEEPIIIYTDEDEEQYCYLSVSCEDILRNINRLPVEKHGLVPQNGIIFLNEKAKFYDKESVFDVLFRELQNAGIHLEFAKTPGYNAVYIEGINNLYEFDCGEQSGWRYSVNGVFPNCDSANYILNQGDEIRWVYNCEFNWDTID